MLRARDPSCYHCLDQFYSGVLSSLVLYAGHPGSQLCAGFRRSRLAYQQTETARLNEQLSKAQLDALRRQIEPHFLFNTLNAISGLVRERRNDAAVSMIAGLSDFLRRLLEDSTRQQVPLGEEVEFAQKYLDIQKVALCRAPSVQCGCPQGAAPGPGSHSDSATHGRKRDQAWHRKTGAGRIDSDCGLAFRRSAHGAVCTTTARL